MDGVRFGGEGLQRGRHVFHQQGPAAGIAGAGEFEVGFTSSNGGGSTVPLCGSGRPDLAVYCRIPAMEGEYSVGELYMVNPEEIH